jgi:CrcB protein
MTDWLAVFIGGGVGSLLRYGLSRWLGTSEAGFPLGTLTANVLACVVLGLAWHVFAQRVGLPPALKTLVLVGFCGGFSTFSTFSFETLRLMQAGQIGLAALYVLASLGSCLLLLWGISKLMA